MELGRAEQIACEFCHLISPLCDDLEVVGSIRRRKEFCKDIDMVLLPKSLVKLYQLLADEHQHDVVIVKWGKKLACLTYQMAQVDLYFATPETWATLLLIRTGSKENNIRLCQAAQAKGWKLKADGTGLVDALGNRRAYNMEEQIYAALGLPYQEPWEREVKS